MKHVWRRRHGMVDGWTGGRRPRILSRETRECEIEVKIYYQILIESKITPIVPVRCA